MLRNTLKALALPPLQQRVAAHAAQQPARLGATATIAVEVLALLGRDAAVTVAPVEVAEEARDARQNARDGEEDREGVVVVLPAVLRVVHLRT